MCYPNVFPTVEELSDLDYCTSALSKLKGVSVDYISVVFIRTMIP